MEYNIISIFYPVELGTLTFGDWPVMKNPCFVKLCTTSSIAWVFHNKKLWYSRLEYHNLYMLFCVLINRLVSIILYITVWFSAHTNTFVIFVLNNISIIT